MTTKKRKRKPREYETVFECPSCNGRTWGTSNCTSPITHWIGHCHDANDVGCRFSWQRRPNDKRVFVRRLVKQVSRGR